MKIENSVVLITGAAMRVGRHVANRLADLGANIAFSYYSDDEPWEEVLEELQQKGVDAFALKTEIRDADQINQLVSKAVERFGKIDILINNASVWLKAPFMEITESDWDMALSINLKGPFLTSQAVASHMIRQKQGVIINITDLSAFQVWDGYAHHAASKAGLVSLTKAMAFELAPDIRVNAIAPGTVLLPDNAPPQKKQWALDMSVLKKIGSPEDVFQVAKLLIENDFITGSVYFIDGGRALV